MDPRTANVQPPFEALKPQESPGLDSKMIPVPDFGEKTYQGFNRLKDKVAIVTGGDSGIGKAVCLAFAREGAHIVCSYLNEHSDAEQTKQFVESAGRKCILVPGDISDDKHCKAIVDKTVQQFGKIDVLVLNAAYQGKQVDKFEDLDIDRVMHTFKTNIVSMFSTVKYALPHMKPGSTIITTSSIQAYDPSAYILDYASTKGSIVAFTKGLAQELIERGIRVNSVAPGPVLTPLVAASFNEEKLKKFGTQSPMKRPAQPAEMAPCYVFLACDESRFVVGEILAATGGAITA